MFTLERESVEPAHMTITLIPELKAVTNLVQGGLAIEQEIVENLDEVSQKRMYNVMRKLLKDELAFVLEVEMLRNKQDSF